MAGSEARRRSLPSLLLGLCCGLTGCAFFESAGDITIGEGQIEALGYDFPMPGYEDFIARREAVFGDASRLAEMPSMRHASLAHVLGLVTLAGHCEQVFREKGLAEYGAASDLEVRLIACPPSGACDHLCGGRRGAIIRASVGVLALDADTAVDLKAKVQQRVRDTLVGARLRFNLVQPYVVEDGERRSLMPMVRRLRIMASDEAGERVELIGDLQRAQLAAGLSVRVTFDPDSELTRGIVADLEAGRAVTFTLDATLHVEPADAYEWPLFSSGFRIEVQPEFVINVLGGLT